MLNATDLEYIIERNIQDKKMTAPKFRAWDKKHKRMWQFADIDSEHGCVSFAYDLNGESYESLGGTEPEEDLVPLQFTGLLDKNGKEIYEGDIIRMSSTAKVSPSTDLIIEASWGIFVARPTNDRFFVCSSIHELCVDHLGNYKPKHGAAGEIIGNIHATLEDKRRKLYSAINKPLKQC